MAVLSKAAIHGAGLGNVGSVVSWSYSEDDWEEYDPETEEAYNEYGDSEGSGGESPGRGGARRPREPELYDAIRHPLSEVLDAVREKLERRALILGGGGGRAQGGMERVKLLVRLGKLLFSVQGRPDPSATLANIPPFSAKKFEDHMNERAPFAKPVCRTYESHLPETAYQQVEDMLLEDGQVAHSLGEKYNIQVGDSGHMSHLEESAYQQMEDMLLGDGQVAHSLGEKYVIYVKKPPVRHALFDIARPDRVVDARLILITETHLSTLDDELQVALDRILDATEIDHHSPGGLRIPAHMTESHGSRGYGGGAGMGYASTRGYGGGGVGGGSSRFVVRAVRHATTRRAEGRGRVWKLARVDGVEFKEGGGRRTNEIELCPVAWQQQLKGGHDGHGSPRGQQPPAWTTEEIMAECPGLLSWLSNEESGNLAGLNGETCENSRGNEESPEEAPLINEIRNPLTGSLNLVRERIEQRALEVGGAGDCGEIEKVKLLVRLGKLLFSVQHRPGESLSRLPSFSAQTLENHMNKRARFKVPIHRTFETHVPDSIYSKLEDMLIKDAGEACQTAALNTSSKKYNIQVIDSEARIRYKVVCRYLAEERQFHVKKVKKLPLRYAVIDIARPEKDVDARLILFTETHLNTLDDELDAAIKRIPDFSQIDSWTPGGLHIPAHMTEGYDSSSLAYSGSGCDGVSRGFGEISGQSDRSRRFQVCAVRHVTIRKAVVGGRVWKFARVDGIEYKQGGGRRTNEIEFCPVAWQHELKCATGVPGSGREQQPPSWSTVDIMADPGSGSVRGKALGSSWRSALRCCLTPPGKVAMGDEEEAGDEDQPQCRICLESDGDDLIAPCKCKGSARFVHRSCLDQWRATKEGFAFCHCSTCKTRFHLRVCPPPDPRFRHLKFRFFVARDIVLVTLLVQLLIICLACAVYLADYCFFDMGIQKAWGQDAPTVFYVYGVLLVLVIAGLFGAIMTCVDRRFRSNLAAPCRDLGECCHRSNIVCGCDCHPEPCCCSCTSCCHPGMCTGQGVLVCLVTTGAILLVVLALVGVFYCLLVSILGVQRLCQRHYHIIAKRILTQEYIVEDLAGMSLPPDWSPPLLLLEHERQLRDLRLL
ncbi:unnamed protein product [Closterium sp. Yama58-4]|nr:unnamed protein product [Closterium sp. Yama58-4]